MLKFQYVSTKEGSMNCDHNWMRKLNWVQCPKCNGTNGYFIEDKQNTEYFDKNGNYPKKLVSPCDYGPCVKGEVASGFYLKCSKCGVVQ